MVKSGHSFSPDTDEKLLKFVKAFSKKNKYPPSLKEMAEHMEVRRETVHYRLQRLAGSGRVKWTKGETRTVRVVR